MRRFFAFALFLCGAAHAADLNTATPATLYLPVLSADAPPDLAPQLVPVATNHALDGIHSDLTRAVIVMHDESRDANAALATLSALAGEANSNTIILAPQFLLASDIENFADHLPDRGKAFAHWPLEGWASGANADTDVGTSAVAVARSAEQSRLSRGVSSFAVVDLLLMILSDRAAFPDVKEIVLAGYGAGGNFVQRYAAFGAAPDILDKDGIHLRFLVASPSSYLYLTANRPLKGGMGGGRGGLGPVDPKECPDSNAYPYGLEHLNDYARHIGANAAKMRYATRFITYVASKGADGNPDTSCAAMAQGADRAMRLANYQAALASLYSDIAARTQTFALLPGARTDAVALFGSRCGMAALFGDGQCAQNFETSN